MEIIGIVIFLIVVGVIILMTRFVMLIGKEIREKYPEIRLSKLSFKGYLLIFQYFLFLKKPKIKGISLSRNLIWILILIALLIGLFQSLI